MRGGRNDASADIQKKFALLKDTTKVITRLEDRYAQLINHGMTNNDGGNKWSLRVDSIGNKFRWAIVCEDICVCLHEEVVGGLMIMGRMVENINTEREL